MSMKLTKKDKIMLAVLGLIIVVAVFFVYGIMPLQEESKTLDGTIATKQTAVQELNNRLAAIGAQSVSGKFDELYEYYYNNQQESQLHEVLDIISIEKKMYALFAKYNIKDYSTAGWHVTQVTVPVIQEEISTTYDYYVANISISFKIPDRATFMKFIEELREDTSLVIRNYSITEQKPTEGGGTGDEAFTIGGSMSLEFAMGDKYKSTVIPKKLDNISMVSIDNNKPDSFIFGGVENAVSYEFYKVTRDENGKRVYTLIKGAKATKFDDTNMTVTFTKDMIPAGEEVEVAVRAIGDQTNYYKTILDKNDGGDTITIKVKVV